MEDALHRRAKMFQKVRTEQTPFLGRTRPIWQRSRMKQEVMGRTTFDPSRSLHAPPLRANRDVS
jgi:hypothetical protein